TDLPLRRLYASFKVNLLLPFTSNFLDPDTRALFWGSSTRKELKKYLSVCLLLEKCSSALTGSESICPLYCNWNSCLSFAIFDLRASSSLCPKPQKKS